MNLQQTFVGLLGTVGAITALDKNTKASKEEAEATKRQTEQAEYDSKVKELKSTYDLKTALREKEYNKNEGIIKSESKAYIDWHNEAIKQHAYDRDVYNNKANEYQKQLKDKYGEKIATEIMREVSWSNMSDIVGEEYNTFMRKDANQSYKNPTTLRAEAYAKAQYNELYRLNKRVNTLKKQYNIGGTK